MSFFGVLDSLAECLFKSASSSDSIGNEGNCIYELELGYAILAAIVHVVEEFNYILNCNTQLHTLDTTHKFILGYTTVLVLVEYYKELLNGEFIEGSSFSDVLAARGNKWVNESFI